MGIRKFRKNEFIRHIIYSTVTFFALFIFLRVQEGRWQFVDSAFITGVLFILTAALRFSIAMGGMVLVEWGLVKLRAARKREKLEHKTYGEFAKSDRPLRVVYEPLVTGAAYIAAAVVWMFV